MAGLEDFDAALETTTLELLGDTIAYTPSGGSPLSLKAIVDYAESFDQLAGSRVQSDDLAVEIARTAVAEPSGADRLTLPKRPGETFKPRDWRSDETGANWLVLLAKVPA